MFQPAAYAAEATRSAGPADDRHGDGLKREGKRCRSGFFGCGDAFGSGGRFNTCFHITAEASTFLVDCGATSLVPIRRAGLDPNAIGTVFISHLHGDHFGGLPFLILEAQYVSRRAAPLTIAGPPGLRERLPALMEAMYPGSSTAERRFALDLVELEPEIETEVGGVAVQPFTVRHPSGAPSFAIRLKADGKVLSYTGDTEWTDALVAAGRDADLLITECSKAEPPAPSHLAWETLRDRLPRIAAKRVLVTHMGPDMIGRDLEGLAEPAEDGLVLTV